MRKYLASSLTEFVEWNQESNPGLIPQSLGFPPCEDAALLFFRYIPLIIELCFAKRWVTETENMRVIEINVPAFDLSLPPPCP